MTMMTVTKKNRQILRNLFRMDRKVSGYKPAAERTFYKFKDPKFGHEIEVMVSEDQRINEYKYEKRKNRRRK
jgi:hypothetical protein